MPVACFNKLYVIPVLSFIRILSCIMWYFEKCDYNCSWTYYLVFLLFVVAFVEIFLWICSALKITMNATSIKIRLTFVNIYLKIVHLFVLTHVVFVVLIGIGLLFVYLEPCNSEIFVKSSVICLLFSICLYFETYLYNMVKSHAMGQPEIHQMVKEVLHVLIREASTTSKWLPANLFSDSTQTLLTGLRKERAQTEKIHIHFVFYKLASILNKYHDFNKKLIWHITLYVMIQFLTTWLFYQFDNFTFILISILHYVFNYFHCKFCWNTLDRVYYW